MTTIKELAALSNLAPSTISKALNNSSEISEETRSKVKKIAKDHGYIANNIARSLKLKRTGTIGVIVPNIVDCFFGKVLHGIEAEACKHGYSVFLTFSGDKSEDEEQRLEKLINQGVDGILISFSKQTQKSENYIGIEKARTYGVPLVMFDRVNKKLPYDAVSIDDFAGAFKATMFLSETGCNKTLFLCPIPNTSVGKSRKEGYLSALRNIAKEDPKPHLIEFESYGNFRQILSDALTNHQIDGILAADENSAVYALNTVQKMGYDVPDDISVIGFTNGAMSKSANPSLTVVSQHAESIGKKSFQLLMDRIFDNNRKPEHLAINPQLIVRESTRPYPDQGTGL